MMLLFHRAGLILRSPRSWRVRQRQRRRWNWGLLGGMNVRGGVLAQCRDVVEAFVALGAFVGLLVGVNQFVRLEVARL